jgi:hypothetical protein
MMIWVKRFNDYKVVMTSQDKFLIIFSQAFLDSFVSKGKKSWALQNSEPPI